MNENGSQKIILNNITLKKKEYPKEFYQDQYYLEILINEKTSASAKSSLLKFNQYYKSYDIDLEISFPGQLDSILFKLYSQKDNSILYQGTFSTLPTDLNKIGEFEYDCDIRNSKKEKISINFVYVNNQIDNNFIRRSSTFQIEKNEKNSEEIFNNYNNYVEKIRKEKKAIDQSIKRVSASTNEKSGTSMLELAKGENAILFNNFVRNTDYIKVLINFTLDFLFWKDPYKTFSLLSIITIFILYTNFFVLILSILLIILFHLSYRDSMEENFSFKNVKRDYSSNLKVIMWIMDLTNHSIFGLEDLLEKMQNNSRELFKEVYINLLKLLCWNIPLYITLSYTSDMIDSRYIKVIGLWAFFLMQYPPFKAFVMIFGKIIIALINDFSNFSEKKSNKKLINNEKILKFVETIIPFYNLGKAIYSKNGKNVLKQIDDAPEIVVIPDKNDDNKLKQMLKYEIYEKQRWSFISWSDDLKKVDGANWVKKGNNKNIFCDKNKIKLPGDEYEWKNEWEVEITNNTDKDGWEYAKNFDEDIWQKNDTNCSVRRRKWIKYAGLK